MVTAQPLALAPRLAHRLGMVPLSFAGVEWLVVDGCALFWPDESILLVADLHLEKASWYAARGQMLPPYDSLATLDRLEHVLDVCGAKQLWTLGDNFHDGHGHHRLPKEALTRLDRIACKAALHWVTGNHDDHGAPADGPINLPGTQHEESAIDGIVLRHIASAAEAKSELSGHYHPCLRLQLRGRRVTRSCFVRSADKLILPAFGALTGGLDARDPAILGAVGPNSEALVVGPEKLLAFPLTASGGAAVAQCR